MTEIHNSLYAIAQGVATAVYRRYRAHVEYSDLHQECLLWATVKSKHFIEQLEEPDHEKRLYNEKRIAYQMKRAAERYARREKATKSGYVIGDEAFYDTATIAQYLPFVISSIANDTALEASQDRIDDGQPRKPSAPAEGGNLLNTLIDIRKAFDLLDKESQNILVMRYYADLPLRQIAEYLECSISTADRRCASAVRKLQTKLGGDTPWS